MSSKDQPIVRPSPFHNAAHQTHRSLENVHSSVEVPHYQASFWQQWKAFVGPAILVSVGYMDPGNWGTDLQGGAQFKYGLLWVVALASSTTQSNSYLYCAPPAKSVPQLPGSM